MEPLPEVTVMEIGMLADIRGEKMSYKLEKPFIEEQYSDFIVEHNHNNGRIIEETDTAVYALEAWEKLVDDEVIDNTEEYERDQAKEKEEQFNKDFFKTSLGYIRRSVNMATGETKDFLSDLLPTISMGVQFGQQVPILTYKQPDFTKEFTLEYMVSLQEPKIVTSEFIQECAMQVSNDFLAQPILVEEK